ncbi:MAG: hypothetical protein P8K79_02345 [Mariniblastus sp.]|nr:hypothetical protein [Mariniblastus sp.]
MSDQPNTESNHHRIPLVLIVVAALAQTVFASVYWCVIYPRAGYETIGYVIACSGAILFARLFQNFRKETLFHFGAPGAACLAGALICNTLLFVFADPWLLAAALVLMLFAIESSIRTTAGKRVYGGVVLPLLALLLPLFSIDMAINDWLSQLGLYCSEPILRVPGILIADEEIPFRFNDELRILPLDFSVRSMLGVPFLVAVGLTLVGLYARRLFHAFLLLISVGFWAVFGQTVLLVTLGVLFQLMFVDVTVESTSLIEVLIVVATVLLIISTDQFLAFWFGPVTQESLESSSDLVGKAGKFWNRCLASRVIEKSARRHSRQTTVPASLLVAVALLSALFGGIGYARFLAIEKPVSGQLSTLIEADDFTVEPLSDLVRYQSIQRNTTSSTGALEYRWYYYFDGVQCLVSASELEGRWADPAAQQKRHHWNVVDVSVDNDLQVIEMAKESGEKGLLFIKELAASQRPTTDLLGHFPAWGSPSLPEMFLPHRVYFKVFVQFFDQPDLQLIDQLKSNVDRLESALGH